MNVALGFLSDIQKQEGVLFFLNTSFETGVFAVLEPAVQSVIHEAIAYYQFTAEKNSTIVIPFFKEGKAPQHIILVGLGNSAAFNKEVMRRAVAQGISKAQSLSLKSVALVTPEGIDHADFIYHASVITEMTCYAFDGYKTDVSCHAKNTLKDIIFLMSDENKAYSESIKKALIVAKAVNTTRDWVNTPPIKATPSYLAAQAEAIARDNNLKITVFSEEEVNAMGMGGLAGVSRGSDQDCKLVILEYRAKNTEKAPTIALVGKGITFDSGGLSLKPANAMETMKTDMAGAAAVINVIRAIAQLNGHVNVIAVAPIAENLPSGKALKPGDIISFYNGKTAEIKNTDAEGRLILADALSYVNKEYKPDVIIDIATLTGACAYALGPFYSGLMSQHDELVDRLYQAADRSGDLVWRLPMGDDYKKAIKSSVADISNTGDGIVKAGATTAAHFLQHFVDTTPWAHLDIAGSDFDVPSIPYLKNGATGVGVRLLIDLLMHW